MCCFSITAPLTLIGRLFPRRVHVSKTNIFARMLAPGVQGLAYSMNLETSSEIAMVLPLPVAHGTGEDAVTFVDLSASPRMFEELAALFPAMYERQARSKGGLRFALPRQKLVVHEVGSFVASYVPARADFDRLDARFRLPDALFENVPAYADHGFAVFQLKPGKVTVHPMGLRFPTRTPDKLFFPTVHVHDGHFHAKARFDHTLYYQRPGRPESGPEEVGECPRAYAELTATDLPLRRRTLHGSLPNEDTWL
jgi:hypothetical protein